MEDNTAFNEYVEYWNSWHADWYQRIDNNPSSIGSWELPKDDKKNRMPIGQYFPEPYWGNPKSENFKGLFLNINPGNAGEEQLISQKNGTNSLLQKFYLNQKSYSETIQELSNNEDYKTSLWMIKYRISWLKKILDDPSIKVNNTLCADLIPWHTESKAAAAKYIMNSSQPIIKQVIHPLIKIASSVEGIMRNKVIVRSSILLNILNKKLIDLSNSTIKEYVVTDLNKPFSKFNSFLTVFNLGTTFFFVFSGGASMILPNPDYYVCPVCQADSLERKTTLKSFIKNFGESWPQ